MMRQDEKRRCCAVHAERTGLGLALAAALVALCGSGVNAVAQETNAPIVLTSSATLIHRSVRWSTNHVRTASSRERRPPPSRRSSAIRARTARFAATSAEATASVGFEGATSELRVVRRSEVT